MKYVAQKYNSKIIGLRNEDQMSDTNSRNFARLDLMNRWETVLELLSLDCVQPFLIEMGLDLDDPAAAKAAARKVLIRLDEAPNEFETKKKILLSPAEELSNFLNDPDLERILEWGSEKFPSSGVEVGYSWSWKRMLWWLAGIGVKEDPPNPPDLPPETTSRVVRATKEAFPDELGLDERLTEADSAEKTDWDALVYSRYEEGTSPLHAAGQAIQAHRFRKAWSQISSELTDQELQNLWRWAREESSRVQMAPDNIEEPSKIS